jgi:hypothetical protein
MASQADHYRSKAEQCRKWADGLPDSEMRSQFLKLAKAWDELAGQAVLNEQPQARPDAESKESK